MKCHNGLHLHVLLVWSVGWKFSKCGCILNSLCLKVFSTSDFFFFFNPATATGLRAYTLLLVLQADKWVCWMGDDTFCKWSPAFIQLCVFLPPTKCWQLYRLGEKVTGAWKSCGNTCFPSGLQSSKTLGGGAVGDVPRSKSYWHNPYVSLINPIVAFGVNCATSWLFFF